MCWSTSKYKDYHIAEVFYLLNVQVEKMLQVVPSLNFVNRGFYTMYTCYAWTSLKDKASLPNHYFMQ